MPDKKKKTKTIRDLSKDEFRELMHKARQAKKLGMNTTHLFLATNKVADVRRKLETFLIQNQATK